MGHIHGFGVKNFRVFKKETVFKFAPITVLTGTNNSGKSSIIKALLLLKENLQEGDKGKRRLSEELKNTSESNLGLFDSFLNTKRKKELSFYISVPLGKVIKNTESDWNVELKFGISEDAERKTGILKSVKFFDRISGVSLFSKDLIKQQIVTPESNNNNEDFIYPASILALNATLVLNGIKNSKNFTANGEFDYDLITNELNTIPIENEEQKEDVNPNQKKNIRKPLSFKYFWDEVDPRSDTLPECIRKCFSEMIKDSSFQTETLFLKTFKKANLRTLRWQSKIRFLLHYRFENQDEVIFQKVEDIESEALKTISQGKCSFENELEFIENLSLQDHLVLGLFSKNNLRNDHSFSQNILRTYSTSEGVFIFELLIYEVLYLLVKYNISDQVMIDFKKYKESHKRAVKNSDMSLYGNSYAGDRNEWLANENLISFEKFFQELVKEVITFATDSVKFIYLPATRTNFKRVSSTLESQTTFTDIVNEFSNKKNYPDFHKEFVDYWLRRFEIGEELVIEPFEGVLKAVYIVKGKQKINIADFGSGSNQILPIILKIVSSSGNLEKIFEDDRIPDSKPKTIIIEEPESNLHPKLQSIFADFIIDAAYKFNLQVIIETHSEYLIRKLQYWTARKVIRPEDTIIHYLTDPQKLVGGKGEQQIRTIRILEDGSLSGDFGPGFFDEATNWQWELMRLKNSQKN